MSIDRILGVLSRRPRAYFVTIVLLFVTSMSALHIHGFSISVWRSFLDQSPDQETIYGKPKSIRSDDWLVLLPAALSQLNSTPPFQVKSASLIAGPGEANGQNVLLQYYVTSDHIATIFRPEVWGYYIGADFGVSWAWWVRIVSGFFTGYLLSNLLIRRSFWLSVLCGATIVWSPFLQFWSHNCAAMSAAMAATVVAFCGLTLASRPFSILLYGIGFLWASCFFALGLYPAYQIQLFWIALGCVGVFFLSNRPAKFRMFKRHLHLKILTFSASIVGILGAVYVFWLDARPAIETLSSTVYPGKRFELGGQMSYQRLFANLFQFLHKPVGAFFYGNPCEGAGPFLLMPIVALVWFGRSIIRRDWRESLWQAMPLLLVSLGFICWALIGFDPLLSKFTLMSHVPTQRVLFGITIVNSLILALFLNVGKGCLPIDRYTIARSLRQKTIWVDLFLLACWIFLVWVVGKGLQAQISDLHPKTVDTCVALVAICSTLIVMGRRSGLALMLLISIGYTYDFNPIVRGGTDYLINNPLSREIRKIDQAENYNSKWVTFNNHVLANLPRIVGVDSFAGVYMVPPLEAWKIMDADGSDAMVYNRYAHITLSADVALEHPQFSSPTADTVNVRISPNDPFFFKLGIRYFLVTGIQSGFENNESMEKIFEYAGANIYRRK